MVKDESKMVEVKVLSKQSVEVKHIRVNALE